MQKTIRQYERDVFARRCESTLLAVQAEGGTVRAALDATIFYPEGGGQPADRGTLAFAQGTAQVLDVHEEDGVIWHTLDALPAGAAPGAAVCGEIDWARRFDHMQQHTGEHILSGTLHRLYGADNVGFHIGGACVRMDTSIPLSAAQLEQAEREANAVIWADAPVQAFYPAPEALAQMTYRSKKAIEGAVRIVSIPGADVCACCGTHVRTAGQVGLIKIIASEHYKGGERLSVVCGARALADMQAAVQRESEIGALLSAKRTLTAEAVQRVYGEYTALKFAHFGMAGRLFEALAAAVQPGEAAVVTLPDLSPDELHRLTQTLCGHTGGLCAALTPNAGGVGYCLGRADGGDVRSLTRALNEAFSGRGGGKPALCQGSCAAGTPEEIEAFLRARAG
jgi:alanyl-tRNA synthetase